MTLAGLSNSSTKSKSHLEVHELLDRFELLYDDVSELKDLRRAILDKDLSSIFRLSKNYDGYLIDELRKSVLEENEIIIDLDVLQNLKNEEYTKGKIVVAHLDKMNPGILYKIMSRINNLDFFKWIDNIMGQKSGDFYAFYKHLNMERNDMTHNLTDTEDSPKDIKRTIITMKNFIFTSYICTNANIDIFQKNKPESFIERQYSEQFKKLKINSDKFKSITKKFREKYKPS